MTSLPRTWLGGKLAARGYPSLLGIAQRLRGDPRAILREEAKMTAVRRRSAISATLCLALGLGLPAQARTPAQNTLAASSNAFGVDLYQALQTRPGNLLFSPLNISVALSMVYSGARGQTAAEMRKVVHIAQTAAENDAATGELMRKTASDTKGGKLVFANAVWVDRSLSLNRDYQRSLEMNYGSELPRLDFKLDRDGSRTTINRWVEGKTSGKITNLLDQAPEGPMVITSAVYLKADWSVPFKKRQTYDEDFHTTRAASVRVPFMHSTESFRYLDDGPFQAVELPYAGGNLAMVLVVPKQDQDLAEIERDLTPDRLEGCLRRLGDRSPQSVTLALPKFKLEDHLELKPLLQQMGMALAFDQDKADLSGIAFVDGNLFVRRAIQKSYASVDEEGTEAAAATALEIVLSSARVPSGPHVTVRADHPFLFVIRDARSDAIIFMGRMAKPLTEDATN